MFRHSSFIKAGANFSVSVSDEYWVMFNPLHFSGPLSEKVAIIKSPLGAIHCSAVLR